MAVVAKSSYPLIADIIPTPDVKRWQADVTVVNTTSMVSTWLKQTCVHPKVYAWIDEHAELLTLSNNTRIAEYRCVFSTDSGVAQSVVVSSRLQDDGQLQLRATCVMASLSLPSRTEWVKDFYIGGHFHFGMALDNSTEHGPGYICGAGPGYLWGCHIPIQDRYPEDKTRYAVDNRRVYMRRRYTRPLNAAELVQTAAYLLAHVK